MPRKTVRLTMAQALVRYLCNQFTEIEGAHVTIPVQDINNAIKSLALTQQRHDLKRQLGSDRDIRATNV